MVTELQQFCGDRKSSSATVSRILRGTGCQQRLQDVEVGSSGGEAPGADAAGQAQRSGGALTSFQTTRAVRICARAAISRLAVVGSRPQLHSAGLQAMLKLDQPLLTPSARGAAPGYTHQGLGLTWMRSRMSAGRSSGWGRLRSW